MFYVPISLLMLSVGAVCAQSVDDLSSIRGVNYVPSTVTNDIGTLMDYNFSLVEQELGFARQANFNTVRLFVHYLPYQFNASRFFEVLDHFVATSDANGLKVFFVLLDSCFGDVNPDMSWITNGTYKNSSWVPCPGPRMVADESTWPILDEYVTAVVRRYANDSRLLGWDVMNEPDFSNANIENFLEHFIALVTAVDLSPAHVITSGLALATEQSNVQQWVRTLSFHSYDGSYNGGNLSNIIAGQQALAKQLGKAVFISESMWRTYQPLGALLPAVYGCLGTNARIGYIIWDLVLYYQYNYSWGTPNQGLMYAEGSSNASQWWSDYEQQQWQNYTEHGCPPQPPGVPTWVSDTDPAIEYAAGADGTPWTGVFGAFTRSGSLHYCNSSGASATFTAPIGTSALQLVHKVGPDCGIITISLDGVTVGSVDTYEDTVDWGAVVLVSGSLDPSKAHTVVVTASGRSNPLSSDTYAQIAGFVMYH
jgi:hypothetical protein